MELLGHAAMTIGVVVGALFTLWVLAQPVAYFSDKWVEHKRVWDEPPRIVEGRDNHLYVYDRGRKYLVKCYFYNGEVKEVTDDLGRRHYDYLNSSTFKRIKVIVIASRFEDYHK